jgi:hypothetical protein
MRTLLNRRDVKRAHAASLRLWAVLCLCVLCVSAVSSTGDPQKPEAPAAEKIGEDRYRVGNAVVDLKAKTLTLTGKVNMQKGLIEYVAVSTKSVKRHESALTLDVQPLHLQVGLILLGLKEPEGGGGLRYQGDERVPTGSALAMSVSWVRGGRTVRVPVGDLVWDIDKKAPISRGSWVFSGSMIDKRGFVADIEQALVATFRDPAAIINNALPGGGDDTLYKVNERIIPPLGTPVTAVFTPIP